MDEEARTELENIYRALTALNVRVEALRRCLLVPVEEMERRMAEVRVEYERGI
jgi:hypothetical protein